MRSKKFLWAAALCAFLPCTSLLHADEIESALRAALDEPPAGQPVLFQPSYDLFGHKFGVTPVQTTSIKKGPYSLSGQLTRSNTAGTSDVIDYKIRRHKGAIVEMSVRINQGEWRALSEPMLKVLGEYATGVVLPVEKHSEVSKTLREAVGDSWQRAAEYLIIQVAVRHC